MPWRLLFMSAADRPAYLRQLAASPCRWASFLTFGWAISVLISRDGGKGAYPGMSTIVDVLGHKAAATILFAFAILPLVSIFIRHTGLRILMTTIPLAGWIFILLQGLKATGLYGPSVWTAIVCILSLVNTELRRAKA